MIINNREELMSYIKDNNKNLAIYTDVDFDFIPMKLITYKKELENVYHLHDLIAKTYHIDELNRFYLDYDEHGILEDDVQAYNGKLLKDSVIVGDYIATSKGLIIKNINNNIIVYDIRGFISHYGIKSQAGIRYLIRNNENKQVSTITAQGHIIYNGNIYKPSDLAVELYDELKDDLTGGDDS